ncbi:MAG: ParA family protein [Pseudomonadales bacterium]
MVHAIDNYPPRVLIVNPKGGCGKTTLATNLATIYAHRGMAATLIDHDPQGSSGEWLARRNSTLPPVIVVEAHKRPREGITRSFQLRLPIDTERIIEDTPAAIDVSTLGDLMRRSRVVLIPVLPSAIDMRAAAIFMRGLLKLRDQRELRTPIAVVANRVRENTLMYKKLLNFLDKVHVPLGATFRDAQAYVHATDIGQGILELGGRATREAGQWGILVRWIEQQIATEDALQENHDTRNEVTARDHSAPLTSTSPP